MKWHPLSKYDDLKIWFQRPYDFENEYDFESKYDSESDMVLRIWYFDINCKLTFWNVKEPSGVK